MLKYFIVAAFLTTIFAAGNAHARPDCYGGLTIAEAEEMKPAEFVPFQKPVLSGKELDYFLVNYAEITGKFAPLMDELRVYTAGAGKVTLLPGLHTVVGFCVTSPPLTLPETTFTLFIEGGA